jgi:soluble lytic murein transglycosylase-like protein
VVEVAAQDFGSREQLAVWLSPPSSPAIPVDHQQTTKEGEAFFTVEIPPAGSHGYWGVSVQGLASQRRASVVLLVAGPAATVTPTAPPTATMPTTAPSQAATVESTVTVAVTSDAGQARTLTTTPTRTSTPLPDNRDIAGLLPPGAPGSSLNPALARTYFGNAARVSGVPIEVLLAIAAVESGFRPNAVGPYLPQFAGTIDEHALGMMQFLPSTYRYFAARVDRITGKNLGLRGVWDPESAVYAAAFYLRDSGAPADMRRALFAYNNADWYVRLVLAWADYYARGGSIGGAPVIDVSKLPDLPQSPARRATETALQASGPPHQGDAQRSPQPTLNEGLAELLGLVYDRPTWPRFQVEARPLPE